MQVKPDKEYPSGLDENHMDTLQSALKDLYQLTGRFGPNSVEYGLVVSAINKIRKAMELPF